MRLFDFTGLQLLFETPGDGGAGGGAGAGAPNSDGAKPGADGQQAGGNGGQASKPGAAGAPSAKFEDDPRFKGVLGDLAKERKARQAAEARAIERDAAWKAEQRRVQALAGVTTPSDQEIADQQVAERLKQLGVPRNAKLASLTDEQIDKLLSVVENADNLSAATQHHWETHGRKMLDGVVSGVSKLLGGQLTARQQQKLEQAYFQAASNSPEFLARHEAGDQKLIEEFVAEFAEDFIEPSRKQALAAEQRRMRGVPVSKDRSVVGAGGKKLDLTKDADFGEAVLSRYKELGGTFGGRD